VFRGKVSLEVFLAGTPETSGKGKETETKTYCKNRPDLSSPGV